MTRRRRKEIERNRQINLQRRSRMCSGKRAYSTEIEADSFARMYSDPRYSKNKGKAPTLRAYYCSCCKMFHLTSKPLMVSG